MGLTLRQIRYFVAVAETGKVITAASAVGISPSAVTEAINDLEAAIGAQLYERQQKGIKLTHEGHRFLQHCRNILAAVSDATYALTAPRSGVSGRLQLGTTITVAGYFLARPLARFRRVFPNIDLRVLEFRRSTIERRLAKGQLELAVMLVSNLERHDELAHETMVRSVRRLWTSANHPLLKPDVVHLADIAQAPYIQLLIDEAEKTTTSYWRRYGLQPRIVLRTESVEAVRSLVATGAGITILSDMVFRPWSLEGDRLEVREVGDDIPTMDVGLAWRRNGELSEPAKAFIDFCRLEYASSAFG
jgi:DNA-binding transcriptional LysR family regulator